jgi:hypothetical protein
MDPHECLVCGDTEIDTDLIWAPCDRHVLCEPDLNSWFERATNNESLFPPNCCGWEFTPSEYGYYLDPEVLRAYRAKANGEFSVLPR